MASSALASSSSARRSSVIATSSRSSAARASAAARRPRAPASAPSARVLGRGPRSLGGVLPEGPDPNAWATLAVAIEASAPIPASRPDQTSRLMRSLSVMARGVKHTARRGASRPPQIVSTTKRFASSKSSSPSCEHPEDPAGEHLLDRAVERHRREVGVTSSRNCPSACAVARRCRRSVEGLADLARWRRAERVRRARDLDDDDLHQVGVVAVGVDDEPRDRVELLARLDRLRRRSRRSPRAAAPSARGTACRAPRPWSGSSGRRARRRRRPRRRCPRRGRCGSPGARRRAPPRRGSAGACRPPPCFTRAPRVGQR